MLGVLKRRWKPKRSPANTKHPGSDTTNTTPLDNNSDRNNRHQVHPVFESQAFLGYDKPPPIPIDRSATPPPPPPPTLQQCYPLAPNICVEAGRIQFIRPELEGGGRIDHRSGSIDGREPRPARITVTRGLQTDAAEGDGDEFRKIQNSLEARITELEVALELAQKNEQRDKQTIAKLQKSLNKRESAHRDADRERRLRADSETRAKQALQEAARCRNRLKLLTNEFARMEETVRSMLTYKKQVEQLKQEKTALTLAFENRCKQYQTTISRLNVEISSLRQQLDQEGQNPECILQAQTAALHRHAEESRKQYERCLDDVANQVVRALLAQKGLKEEVGSLNSRIQELESQNRALSIMLVHQLRGETPSSDLDNFSRCLLNEEKEMKTRLNDEDKARNRSTKSSPTAVMSTSLNMKHCNSFNSDILDESPKQPCVNTIVEKRLSADTSNALDTRLSLEDKKRHQVLTKLWTELKGTEVTPRKLLEALSAVDSALWVPPKRPMSLNLQLPVLQTTKYKAHPILSTQTSSKSESEEATGNESPESGNRDEGYSTMSSDVQADLTRGDATLPRRDLEDLKEETELTDNRLLVTDAKDPDILYIPMNLLNLKQRNSYPPGKGIVPFQHIMRSFSDSHLCIKITTAPTPCYTFSSPISSTPSFFLFDFTADKAGNPLRRARGGHNLMFGQNHSLDDKTSQLSWSSATEDGPWDPDYIQHWLRLDETRSAMQQHRDMLELEYDRAELEDWSLSLSTDDLREQWKRSEQNNLLTPSQISISTLPSIQENNQLELEEDANECLWNNSSYMVDKEGRELVTLLMDGQQKQQWPYAVQSLVQQISPDNSWSSNGSDCFSQETETCSKRSSAALSGSSEDNGEVPTDFTRDFYRLVKFESTKSLASISSRSLGENGEQSNLQNVLSFIAEQQKYVASCDDSSRPQSINITNEFNVEGPSPVQTNIKLSDSDNSIPRNSDDSENYVTLRQLCEEFKEKEEEERRKLEQNIAYAEEICLENCSNISEHPVDICSSVNVELASTEYQSKEEKTIIMDQLESVDLNCLNIDANTDSTVSCESVSKSDISTAPAQLNDSKSDVCDLSDLTESNDYSTSLSSSVSTSDTIVSKIPLRKTTTNTSMSTSSSSSSLRASPKKERPNNNYANVETRIPKSKTTYGKNSRPLLKKIVHVHQPAPAQHPITSERLPQSSSGVLSNIIEGPPHRAVSFHERATSKDVIDELNRMIKNGDGDGSNADGVESGSPRLDQGGRPTGWNYVERDVDISDPKARAGLLEVMMTSVSSDSSPTSSCGGSIASDSMEDPPDYGQLHRIHKYHRQKKACAVRPELAVVRAGVPLNRPTIIGRPDFYVRYGEKEREAVASFDFLDDLSTTSSSLTCSMDDGAALEEPIMEESVGRGRCKVSEV